MTDLHKTMQLTRTTKTMQLTRTTKTIFEIKNRYLPYTMISYYTIRAGGSA